MLVGVDPLDARLLRALAESPRSGTIGLARHLGVARGTVDARLEKLLARGVIRGFGPDLDVGSIGYPVLAFATLEVAQGRLHTVVDHIAMIPEVLEAHTISGPGDLLCRLVARSNEHLQDVLTRLVDGEGILRSSSVLALTQQIPYSTLQLLGARQLEPECEAVSTPELRLPPARLLGSSA